MNGVLQGQAEAGSSPRRRRRVQKTGEQLPAAEGRCVLNTAGILLETSLWLEAVENRRSRFSR